MRESVNYGACSTTLFGRTRMKSIVLVAVALLLGLILGGWAPRSEVARLKKELTTKEELLKSSDRSRSGIDNVTRMIGIDRTAARTSPEVVAMEPQEALDQDQPDNERPDAGITVSEEIVKDTKEKEPEDVAEEDEREMGMEESIEHAMELWQIRVDIARNTLISNAQMTPVEVEKFDLLVSDMNSQLKNKFTEFAEDLQDAEEVQMEAGIRIFNDVTDSIVSTYDAMDETLEPGWRRSAGPKFSLTDFISPDVAEPLIGVESKLDRIGGQRLNR